MPRKISKQSNLQNRGRSKSKINSKDTRVSKSKAKSKKSLYAKRNKSKLDKLSKFIHAESTCDKESNLKIA